MKSTEFRIGNLVEAYLEPQISEWVEIEVSLETLRSIESNPETHGYRSIPLTEEWLKKFGLLKNNEYPFIFLLGFIKIRNGVYFYKYHQAEVNLEYVHQLQNLYHALTGQELTIKE